MSHPTVASSSSPSFQLIMNSALDTYKKRTRRDLRAHPLAVQLQTCGTPSAIIAVLQEQLQGLDQSRSNDARWTNWLDPTVNVLSAFSDIVGAGVSLVCFRTCNFLRSAVLYYLAAISPCERDFHRSWRPPFSVYILVSFHTGHYNT